MKRLTKSVLTAVAIFTVTTGSASAATVIDFLTGGGGPGGTVNIGANVTGSGLFIDAVTILGAPVISANGTFDVEGSGACLDASGGCGLLSFDKNLNTISLVGSIPALGILAPITLLSGDLSSGVKVFPNGDLTGITVSGLDTKAAQLLTAIGLASTTPFGFFGFETTITSTGQVVATDITNSTELAGGGQPLTPVPEPGSLILFGTGLVAVASGLRRRYSNKS